MFIENSSFRITFHSSVSTVFPNDFGGNDEEDDDNDGRDSDVHCLRGRLRNEINGDAHRTF